MCCIFLLFYQCVFGLPLYSSRRFARELHCQGRLMMCELLNKFRRWIAEHRKGRSAKYVFFLNFKITLFRPSISYFWQRDSITERTSTLCWCWDYSSRLKAKLPDPSKYDPHVPTRIFLTPILAIEKQATPDTVLPPSMKYEQAMYLKLGIGRKQVF